MAEARLGWRNEFPMYTIYDHPADYPEHWVVRAWWVDRDYLEPFPGGVALAETLQGARDALPIPNLTRLPPMPGDDPTIVETWL